MPGGLQYCKLYRNQRENDRLWQKTNFVLFVKIFENGQFFAHLHSNIFFNKIKISKNHAEFYADFQFVDAYFNVFSRFFIAQLVSAMTKKNQIFLKYKEIQKRSSCKVIYEEGLPNISGNTHIFSHI